MATATLPTQARSTVVSEVRAILYSQKGAGINTRFVRLHPSAPLFFRICNGLDLLDPKAVATAFASEMFQLSNDPSRQEQREQIWPHRSLSVGDVVEVDFCTGITMVVICLGCGWHAVNRLGRIDFSEGEWVHSDAIELLDRLENAGGYFEREEVIRGIKPTLE
jgi:hypothetical protein